MRSLTPKLFLVFAVTALVAAPARAISPIDPATTKLTIDDQDVLHIEVKQPDGTVQETTERLIRVKKGEKFFHWTLPENVDRWSRQGHIDRGEIEYLSKPTGDRQVYGAGYYVSADPLDSSGFGAKAVVAEAPEDFFITDSSLRNGEEAQVKRTHDALREKKIYGSVANDRWRVFWDEHTVQNVKTLDGQAVLDHYHAKGEGFRGSYLETLASRFDLKPHPALDQALPGLNKLLTRRPVSSEELDGIVRTVYGGDGTNLKLRQLLRGKISTATIQEHLIPFFGKSERSAVSGLLYTDQVTGGLKSSPALKSHYPAIAAFLEGTPLTSSQRETLLEQLLGKDFRDGYGALETANLKTETPLLRKIKEEFAPELRTRFKARLAYVEDYSAGDWVRRARELGVRLSELAPGQRDPGGNLPEKLISVEVPELKKTLNPFGQNLAESFAFIDHFDLARAVAQGNPEPWKLYDEPGEKPLLEKWRDAAKVLNETGDVIKTHEALLGKPSEFRGARVVAGGDVRLPGDDFGYARVTEDQLAALKNNPYVKIYLKDDPWPQHPGRKSFLVRYEYPSAATYEHLKPLLSRSLIAKLEEAKKAGHLASEAAPEFRALTQEMLRELWDSANRSGDPLQKYRARVSVHPFTDYNGRITRLYYQAETTKPLVMPQWDLDLYSHPLTLTAHRDKGEHAYRKIVNALAEAQAANPQFPRFYEAPELFETLLDLPPEKNVKARARHLNELKSFLKSPEAGDMIRKKEITEIQWKLWDLEGRNWAKLPESERASILRKWMMGGFTPEFSDAGVFKQVLQESIRLARGKDAPKAARWWLQLGSGIDPAHGGVLQAFLKDLPEHLKGSFMQEWVKGQTVLHLPMSAEARAAIYNNAREAIKLGPAEDRQAWASFFVKQHLANPAEAKKPFAEVLRLSAELNAPEMIVAFKELLTTKNYPHVARLQDAAFALPQEQFAFISDDLYASFSSLPPERQGEMLKRALRAKREPLYATIISDLERGAIGRKFMEDPEILGHFLRAPNANGGGVLTAERLRRLRDNPATALQSLADRKDWKNFIELTNALRFGELEKREEAVLRSGLKRFRAEAPANGLAADILEARLIKDPAAADAALEKVRSGLLANLGEASFPENYRLFTSGSEGKRFLSLLPEAVKKSDAQLRQLILASSPRMLDYPDVPKGVEEAVKKAIRTAPPEQVTALAKRFRTGGRIEDQYLAETFRRLSFDDQLAFLVGRKGLNTPWALVEEAVRSADPRVQDEVLKEFIRKSPESDSHVRLLKRLITKGENALLDEPLRGEWIDPVARYLQSRGEEAEKVAAKMADDLRPLTLKIPQTTDEAMSAAQALAFLSRVETHERHLQTVFEALEASAGKPMPKEAREVMDEVLLALLRNNNELRDGKADLPRLHNIFQKSKNQQILSVLLGQLEDAPDSAFKFRAMLDAFRYGERGLHKEAFDYFNMGINNKVTPYTDAQKAELRKTFAEILDAEHMKTAAEWDAYRKSVPHRNLDYFGSLIGFDTAHHIKGLEARGRPIAAGAQGVTCSFHFNRLKFK